MKNYPSKLLLFGEYTVVKGSRALAIPYHKYAARWSFENQPNSVTSNAALVEFHAYLSTQNDLSNTLDLSLFAAEIRRGIWLDSAIPSGYGLGSSGSVCAAVYDRYTHDKPNVEAAENLQNLKSFFAKMESFFHGASSGTDPLVCYLNEAVLLEKNTLDMVQIPEENTILNNFFLINTHLPRKTEPLVDIFLKKCKNPDFDARCKQELATFSDACIDAFLANDDHILTQNFRKLSQFQYKYFSEMIPEKYKSYWAAGLASGDYFLKLCGAGGGGFILGYAPDIVKINLGDLTIEKMNNTQ